MWLLAEQVLNVADNLKPFLQQWVIGRVQFRPDSRKIFRPGERHQINRLGGSITVLRIPLVLGARPGRQQTPQVVVWWGGVIQECQKNLAVTVGKRSDRFLDEGQVVFWNDTGFTDAKFVVTDLFD